MLDTRYHIAPDTGPKVERGGKKRRDGLEHRSDLPRVQVNTSGGRSSGLLDGLLGVLELHVGLTGELVGLDLSVVGKVLRLVNSLVDAVTDRREEEGGGGGEERVCSVLRHFEWWFVGDEVVNGKDGKGRLKKGSERGG